MFRNIGLKIKILAMVLLIFGIALFFTFGLLTIKDDNYSQGAFIIIIGCIASCAASFFIYGFGELIDKTTEIAENTKTNIKKTDK